MRREGSLRNHSCDWEGRAQISLFGSVLDSLSVLRKIGFYLLLFLHLTCQHAHVPERVAFAVPAQTCFCQCEDLLGVTPVTSQ